MVNPMPYWIGRTDANTNSGSSTTLTVPLPSGTQQDDLLVAVVHSQAATATATGFVEQSALARTSGNIISIKTKWVGSGETDPIFTFTASSNIHYVILTTYRGVGEIGPVAQSNYGASVTNLTLPPLTTTYPNAVVFNQVFMLRTTSGDVTWPVQSTERSDTVSNASAAWWLLSSSDQPMSTPGATPSTVAAQSSSSGSGSNGVGTSLALYPPNRIPVYKDVSHAQITTAGTSLTINYPAGSVSGDFLLMSVGAGNTTANTVAITTPAGWTLAGNLSNSGMEGSIYWRVRGAETSVTVTHASAFSNGIIVAFDPARVDTGNPINQIAGDYNTTSSTTGISTPAVTTTVDDCRLVLFTHAKRSSLTTATTISSIGSTSIILNNGGTGLGTYFLKAATLDTDPTPGTYAAQAVTYSGATNRRFVATVAIQPPQSATISDSDSSTATDTAYADATAPAAQDSGTATENDSTLLLDGTPTQEAVSVNEMAALTATTSDADTSTGLDDAAVSAVSTDSDSVAATDDAFVTNTVIDQDSATATDPDAGLIVSDVASELSTATDDSTLSASTPVSDSATQTDNDPLIVITADIDPVTGTDAQSVTITVSEDVAATDSAPIPTATVFGTDSAALTDDQTISLTADFDPASATDNAVRSVEGVLVAPRVYTILADPRTYTVPFESRVLIYYAQNREYVVPSELSVGNN